jgi:hypothetical protein
MQRPVVHELIHAYDYCRVKNFDQTNCDQIACTEVTTAQSTINFTFLFRFVQPVSVAIVIGQKNLSEAKLLSSLFPNILMNALKEEQNFL